LAQTRFPDAEHTCVAPAQDAIELIKQGAYQAYVGYSLGASLVLSEVGKSIKAENVYLMAPFVNVAKQASCLSKLSIAQVEWLCRLGEQNPKEALTRFYSFAGLADKTDGTLPYSKNELLWGLSYLLKTKATVSIKGIVQLILGGYDKLVDKFLMQALFPDAMLIEEAGHDYRDLISYLKIGAR